MNAEHDEAMEIAKVSKRGKTEYMLATSATTYGTGDLMEFMRGGGLGAYSDLQNFFRLFGLWFVWFGSWRFDAAAAAVGAREGVRDMRSSSRSHRGDLAVTHFRR